MKIKLVANVYEFYLYKKFLDGLCSVLPVINYLMSLFHPFSFLNYESEKRVIELLLKTINELIVVFKA